MKAEKSTGAPKSNGLYVIGLLATILIALFWRCLLPGYVQFSNDGPLGQQMPAWIQIPLGLTGMWDDMNYAGWNGGAFQPDFTALMRWALGVVVYSKFYAPVALFILGLGAWTFFRALRFSPLAAALGALVMALNSPFFSTACWGVASQQIAYGFDLMALALVVSLKPEMPLWARAARLILAGLAVGMNLMEAADIGALMSIFVAAFVFYHAWVANGKSIFAKITQGTGRVAVIALSAALISAYALTNLIGTQIQGVAGTQQDDQTKQARWDFATQWSFPKRETLALVVPGIFGYRMDSPDGGNYWGVSGRDPAWHRYFDNGKQGPPPQGYMRQSGGGCYLGVSAVLIALWAVFQAFRKSSIFTMTERKMIWFWVAAAAVSLLLAFGRFAPFFQFVYAIPYASTVRNPGKFLAVFTISFGVLVAYGVHGLSRGYLETALASASGLGARLKSWLARAAAFDKRWFLGSLAAIGVSLAGWAVYASSKTKLQEYLQEVQFDEGTAASIAQFSIRQAGWGVLFLTLGVLLMTLILCGAFAGRRAKTGGILLGLLLVVDLARVDLNWVKPVNYKEKNESNPILEILRQKPYEHRVAILPFRAPPQYALFDQIYRIEWAQHQMPYYNIQSLDVIQLPRMPQDYAAFEAALMNDGTSNTIYRLPRRWALTNTRYLLGPAGFLEVLNHELDPAGSRFRIAASFDVVPRPGIARPTRLEEMTAALNPSGNGEYALFDFGGALPRARLFTNWRTCTNEPSVLNQWVTNLQRSVPADMYNAVASLNPTDQATLKELGSPSFDPLQTVLLASSIPMAANALETATNAGTAEYVSYSSKDIKLKTKSEVPAVLLLSDKYDPNWQVWVDGQRAELLRCNFLMRGVHLPAGEHTVEFFFKPDVRVLYISLAGIALGVLLSGLVLFQSRKR